MPKKNINFGSLINHWTIMGVLIVAFLIYWKFFSIPDNANSASNAKTIPKVKNTKENFTVSTVTNSTANVGQCSSEKGCAENKNLLPIMNPLFNMREVCKQCILLEDHLFQTRKRCEDCCKKHFLTMEGLAEEAITLDKENQYSLDKLGLPDKIRDLQKCYISGDDPVSIAQKLRQIRKPLMVKYFDQFE